MPNYNVAAALARDRAMRPHKRGILWAWEVRIAHGSVPSAILARSLAHHHFLLSCSGIRKLPTGQAYRDPCERGVASHRARSCVFPSLPLTKFGLPVCASQVPCRTSSRTQQAVRRRRVRPRRCPRRWRRGRWWWRASCTPSMPSRGQQVTQPQSQTQLQTQS